MGRSLIIILTIFFFSIHAYAQNEIFVSVNGSLKNDGSEQLPVNSIQRAITLCRERNIKKIIVGGGDYYNTNISITPQDDGLVIENKRGEQPVLYAGLVVDSLQTEGNFIVGKISGAQTRKWDFRMLLVNGSYRSLSRYPETGELTYKNQWNVKSLPATQGFWERQPTKEEKTVLKYSSDDIKPGLLSKNAEIQLYHQWDESYVGIDSIDEANNAVRFNYSASFPLGAYANLNPRANKYVVYNTLIGMRHPGNWYLDRENEKLIYFPYPGENINNIKIVAPKYNSAITFGNLGSKNITIIGLKIEACSNKLQNEGYGASLIDGAISGNNVNNIVLKDIIVARTGGSAVKLNGSNITVDNMVVDSVYAGGIYLTGNYNVVKNCHVENIGLLFKGAVGIYGLSNGCSHNLFENNLIENGPYCGICGCGDSSIIRYCRIRNVMSFMNDGAAIYNGLRKDVTVRGNVIVGGGNMKIGIYFDEASTDVRADSNIVVNASWPVHLHIATNVMVAHNAFATPDALTISIQQSKGVEYIDNSFIANSFIYGSYKLNNTQDVDAMEKNVFLTLGNSFSVNSLLQKVGSSTQISENQQRNFSSYSSIYDYIKNLNLAKDFNFLTKDDF